MVVVGTYERKTFRVQAIRVTHENAAELAEWCGGELKDADLPAVNSACIIVPAARRNTHKARVGDWITSLGVGNNFRVYQNKVFLEAFKELQTGMDKYAEVQALVKETLEDLADGYRGTEMLDMASKDLTTKICNLF